MSIFVIVCDRGGRFRDSDRTSVTVCCRTLSLCCSLCCCLTNDSVSLCVADSDVTVFIYRQLQDKHSADLGDIIFINLDIIKIFSLSLDIIFISLDIFLQIRYSFYIIYSMIIINFVLRLSLCVLTPSLPLVIFSSHYHTNVTIIIII
jgi:hypothetical protein